MRCADYVIYVDTNGDDESSIKCCMLKKTCDRFGKSVSDVFLRCVQPLLTVQFTCDQHLNINTISSWIWHSIVCIHLIVRGFQTQTSLISQDRFNRSKTQLLNVNIHVSTNQTL